MSPVSQVRPRSSRERSLHGSGDGLEWLQVDVPPLRKGEGSMSTPDFKREAPATTEEALARADVLLAYEASGYYYFNAIQDEAVAIVEALVPELRRLYAWFDKAIAEAKDEHEPSTFVAWLESARNPVQPPEAP